MVSIKEVAKHAELAISTVSRSLKWLYLMSVKRRRKVQDAIKGVELYSNSIADFPPSSLEESLVLDPVKTDPGH